MGIRGVALASTATFVIYVTALSIIYWLIAREGASSLLVLS